MMSKTLIVVIVLGAVLILAAVAIFYRLFAATGPRPEASPSTEIQPHTKVSQPAVSDPVIEQLNEAIRKDPTNASLYWRRASALFHRDQDDLAFPDFDEAIRLDPTNSSFFDDRGFAHHMQPKREERKALADYNEAVRLNPANHHAINNRAYLLATTLDDQVRNGKQAVADAIKACEMTGWSKAGYLDTLAVAYAEAGDFEQAIKWQKKSLENATFAAEWGENARKQLELFRRKKPYRE